MEAEGGGAAAAVDPDFPCSITLDIPFPTPRLAATALRALVVDKELSTLVRRDLSTVPPFPLQDAAGGGDATEKEEGPALLRTTYKATTNRMLRLAVNSFMDSLALVVEVMEKLDVDVLAGPPGAGSG